MSNKIVLNNVETCLVGGGMLYLLGTPYQLTNNPTVTAGNTTTLTCAGVGGIPSSALAVLISIGIYSSSAAGGYIQVFPHGNSTPAAFPTFISYQNNQYQPCGMAIIPLTSQQIDVKATGQNMVLQSWYIYGYFN